METFGRFGPDIEIVDMIADGIAEFSIDRTYSLGAHFFEFAMRETEIMRGLRGIQVRAAFARDRRPLDRAVVFVIRRHREFMRDSGEVEGGRIWRDGKFAPRHAALCTV